MEDKKKPQRFAVRLSALFAALLLVVCSALPIFAYGTFPEGVPNPYFYEDYFIIRATVNNYAGYQVFSLDLVDSIEIGTNRYYLEKDGRRVTVEYYSNMPSWNYWSQSINNTNFITNVEFGTLDIVYSTYDVVYDDDYIRFVEPPPPPPPDPMRPFNSGLTIVMDWVGSVVSAVVSGPMSGLLSLLAVPVAITLLLVAFIVIRRIIWGA